MSQYKKDVEFLGSSLKDLRKFPDEAKKDAGDQLRRVQYGEEPDNWKPMSSIGAGVNEIRIQNDDGQYRVVYVAKFESKIFVLHCFQKKTQKTTKADLDLAKARYNTLLKDMKK